MSKADDVKAVRRGIAAYHREQAVLLRLLRFKQGFTEQEFDKWFRGRERLSMRGRRRWHIFPLNPNSYILGGLKGGQWAKWLHLLQIMMSIGLVEAKQTRHGIFYSLPPWDLRFKRKQNFAYPRMIEYTPRGIRARRRRAWVTEWVLA